jgi:hypothetical protein
MDEQDLDLDLEDLWPPARELVGLQFETAEDFARVRAILWEHPNSSMGMDPEERYVVVRKVDAHLFDDARLPHTTVEFIDLDDLPPQERYEIEREMIERYKPRFYKWLRERP